MARVNKSQHQSQHRRQGGFTFLELLIVMTIMAIMASVAIPVFITNIRAARELRLRQDLMVMRDAIDKFTVDKERAPQSLDELVDKGNKIGYLREVPKDPITGRADTWITEMETETLKQDVPPGIRNVRSGATGPDHSDPVKQFSEY